MRWKEQSVELEATRSRLGKFVRPVGEPSDPRFQLGRERRARRAGERDRASEPLQQTLVEDDG